MDETDDFFDKVGTDLMLLNSDLYCHPGAGKLFERLDGCYCECCLAWPGLVMPSAGGTLVSKDHSYILNIEYTLPDIGDMP